MAHALSDALDRHLGHGASRSKRDEHSLADIDELRGLVEAAGFTEVRVDTVSQTVRFASVADYVRVQLTATPLAALLVEREPFYRERLVSLICADLAARLAPFTRKDRLAFPQEVNVAQATV